MGELLRSNSFEKPRNHIPTEAPLCQQCQKLDLTFFDPECQDCFELLHSPTVTVPEIFAIMRQWTRQVQSKIDLLVDQILARNCHVDDRDGLTDMTVLHYACKAGAPGVGDAGLSLKAVQKLISLGADVRARCRWSHMTALHFATFFNNAESLRFIIESDNEIDIDDSCHEYDNGSPLHMAAGSLSLEAAKVLVEFGANRSLKDDLGRTPLDCIPDLATVDLLPEVDTTIEELHRLLSERSDSSSRCHSRMLTSDTVGGRAILKAMGLRLGDRVMVNGSKVGILRYCGTTEFAHGVWAGVELDTAEGRHSGTVNDVTYFRCSADRGIFTPVNRISRISGSRSMHPTKRNYHSVSGAVSSSASEKNYTQANSVSYDFSPGDRVAVKLVASGHQCTGTVRYAGTVSFSSGIWYGIEADSFDGRNDGTAQGVRYFTCQQGKGIFAPASKLERLKEDSPNFTSLPALDNVGETSLSSLSSRQPPAFEEKPLRRSFSTRHRSEVQKEFDLLEEKSPLGRTGPVKSLPRPRVEPPAWQHGNPEPLTRTSSTRKKKDEKWLSIGMNVLYQHEVGVIKYIGQVKFADGVWLGLEMRNDRGKHDGTVQNVRYFVCKMGRGLFVRPSAVTVRGINGALLVKEGVE